MAQRISGTPGTLGAQPAAERARTAAETTPDNPWPLSLLSRNIKAYIDRMSAVWIEGQVIELNRRGKASYLTLRDVDEEMSLPVQVWNSVLDRIDAPLSEGARVVVNVKADFWLKAGRLSMRANDIRPVGLGELLARLEKLRRQLGAEGLFAPELKRRLPFLPNRIGLITGRDSDAKKDVLRNTLLRWPAAEFEIREVAVQGAEQARVHAAGCGLRTDACHPGAGLVDDEIDRLLEVLEDHLADLLRLLDRAELVGEEHDVGPRGPGQRRHPDQCREQLRSHVASRSLTICLGAESCPSAGGSQRSRVGGSTPMSRPSCRRRLGAPTSSPA